MRVEASTILSKDDQGDSRHESPGELFQKYLETLNPEGKEILKGSDVFFKANDKIQQAKIDYFKTIEAVPFIFFIWVWTTKCLENNEFGHSCQKDIQQLLDEKIINSQSASGQYLTLGEYVRINHSSIIDSIRGKKKWPLMKREMIAWQYIDFTEWLSEISFGFVSKAKDPDEIKRVGRVLKYAKFIELIDQLDDRYQLVAKLLYFGGTRTLDEVLTLKIEDIDFSKKTIRFDSTDIQYPFHVFEDLSDQIRHKDSGLVFVNRDNAPLNPTTIFRNFKEAALKVGLGENFSPKILTSNL